MTSKSSHRARKRFGQNFLQDASVIQRIADSVVKTEDLSLVEIGPGQGAITKPLLQRYEHLTAVEVDRDLADYLRNQFSDKAGFKLINADILKTDICSLLNGKTGLSIAGNLPYNISTPLIFHLLQHHELVRQMVFMLQMEVVDRMCAKPGDSGYGRLSIMVQYYCQVEKLFMVPPEAFYPVPAVHSAVVRLVPWQQLPCPAQNPGHFAILVRDAFNQRRKTLRNSLKNHISSAALAQLGIDGSLRPEALTLADYVSISNALSS